jgi:hypothetical protein
VDVAKGRRDDVEKLEDNTGAVVENGYREKKITRAAISNRTCCRVGERRDRTNLKTLSMQALTEIGLVSWRKRREMDYTQCLNVGHAHYGRAFFGHAWFVAGLDRIIQSKIFV